MTAVLEVLIYVTQGGWILFEILLLVRDRRHGRGGVLVLIAALCS